MIFQYQIDGAVMKTTMQLMVRQGLYMRHGQRS